MLQPLSIQFAFTQQKSSVGKFTISPTNSRCTHFSFDAIKKKNIQPNRLSSTNLKGLLNYLICLSFRIRNNEICLLLAKVMICPCNNSIRKIDPVNAGKNEILTCDFDVHKKPAL